MCEPSDNLTREEFVRVMAGRIGDDVGGAEDVLNDFLRDEGVAFGDPAFDWCEEAAREMIDEMVLQYCDY